MRKWAGGLALAAALGGCSTEGNAQPQALWDPCQIPAESLAAVGVGPAVRSTDFLGSDLDDWKICTWRGESYSVAVLSTSHSFDDVKTNPRSYDFKAVRVGSREAVSYLGTEDPPGICDVAFDTSEGVLVVQVIAAISAERPVDSCNEAVRAANVLDPALPS